MSDQLLDHGALLPVPVPRDRYIVLGGGIERLQLPGDRAQRRGDDEFLHCAGVRHREEHFLEQPVALRGVVWLLRRAGDEKQHLLVRRWGPPLHDPPSEPPHVGAVQRHLGVGVECRPGHRGIPLLVLVVLAVEQAQRGDPPRGGVGAVLRQLPEPAGPDHVPDQLELLPGGIEVVPDRSFRGRQPVGLGGAQHPFRQQQTAARALVGQQRGVHQVHAHVHQESEVGWLHDARRVDQAVVADRAAEVRHRSGECPGVTPQLERVPQNDHFLGNGTQVAGIAPDDQGAGRLFRRHFLPVRQRRVDAVREGERRLIADGGAQSILRPGDGHLSVWGRRQQRG